MTQGDKGQDIASDIMSVTQMSDEELVDFLLPAELDDLKMQFARGILLNRLGMAEKYKDIIINMERR